MKPIRDPSYLKFIRTQPCLVCWRQSGIEAAHTGPHGLGQKSSDTTAIPLCHLHHTKHQTAYHKLGRLKFENFYQLDIDREIIRLKLRAEACGVRRMEAA